MVRDRCQHGPVPLALFVYGTLMPDHLRWPMLAADATSWVAATAAGQLFDTGWGWPAARFAALGDDQHSAASIPGWLVQLEPAHEAALLAELDAMEGIAEPADPALDPYVRAEVEVTLHDGTSVAAWAYHATSVDPRWRPIERWAGDDER